MSQPILNGGHSAPAARADINTPLRLVTKRCMRAGELDLTNTAERETQRGGGFKLFRAYLGRKHRREVQSRRRRQALQKTISFLRLPKTAGSYP